MVSHYVALCGYMNLTIAATPKRPRPKRWISHTPSYISSFPVTFATIPTFLFVKTMGVLCTSIIQKFLTVGFLSSLRS